MKINIADSSTINKLLQRKKSGDFFAREVNLEAILREILVRANEFVPSESGSILLDDPVLKIQSGAGKLCFIACFGEGSESLCGTSLADHVGIAGETYRTGRSYLSENVSSDDKFYSKIDKETKFVTRSIIAVPIEIEGSVIGVIELLNRHDHSNYDRKDLSLLEIFAGYTSTLIQNALDARRFEDMSKRDNLTGLYNDRYFYEMLARGVRNAMEKDGDISLIFFDLDRFKEINDTHGHLAGSQVLQEVAQIMQEVFNEIPATLARYGGDEYVILIPDMEGAKAFEHAEIFRKKVSDNNFLPTPVRDGTKALNIKGVISCSVGVASLKKNVDRTKSQSEIEGRLLKAADETMYIAKSCGKNRVVLCDEYK